MPDNYGSDNAFFYSSLPFPKGRPYSQQRLMSTVKDEMDPDEDRKLKLKKATDEGKAAVKVRATSLKDFIMSYPRKYGKTFIGTYLSVYVLTLGSFFGAIDSGLMDPATLAQIELPWHSGRVANAESAADAKEFTTAVELVASYMKKYQYTEPYADCVENNPHLSNLAIAWVATKLTEPIRLFVSLGISHRVSKALGIGTMKGDTESLSTTVKKTKKENNNDSSSRF